jgi:hypothetical protein
METYGDLKKVIKSIQLKQKGEKVGKATVDAVLGAIPGLGAAKTTYDFLSAAFRKPDTKKTKSWLDKLDIDDEVEAIVDDTVENGFLKALSQTFDSEPNDKPLEQDFNMNAKMVDYLKNKYEGRTVTGIQENMNMKKRFQKLAGIKEQEQQKPEVKLSPSIKTISKDLSDQGSNFKQINNKDKMVELLDIMVGKIKEHNPDFVEGGQFKQAIIAFYNKYK